MEVFKRFFKRAFVFGVFAQPIIYFAYAFLNLCPFQRFTPFGYDFLLVFETGDCEAGNIFAVGERSEQREHVTQFALNGGPKFGEQGVGKDFFGFSQVENSISQGLNIVFLAPIVIKQVSQFI